MSVFIHLGDRDPDYRSVMAAQSDFIVKGRLIPKSRTVICEQTHSDIIHICRDSDGGAGFGDHPQIPEADGLMTSVPGLYLLIRTADCTPVILADRHSRAVAAVHSGREGSRRNIAGKAVMMLMNEFQLQPEDILAYIGAGVCADHYEVSEQVWDQFALSILSQGLNPGQFRHPDIRKVILQQLISAGIPRNNIEQDFTCTHESQRHFSYRRDGSRNRQINLIGIEYE